MRVLVIEDEPKLAGLIEGGLVEEGYAVDRTASGAEADRYTAGAASQSIVRVTALGSSAARLAAPTPPPFT